jgi:hypothetical protein
MKTKQEVFDQIYDALQGAVSAFIEKPNESSICDRADDLMFRLGYESDFGEDGCEDCNNIWCDECVVKS